MARKRTLKYWVIRRYYPGDVSPRYLAYGQVWSFDRSKAYPFITSSLAKRHIPKPFDDEYTQVVKVVELL